MSHNAEDGGARADAESRDHDSEHRNAGIAPEGANGVAKVLNQSADSHGSFDGRYSPGVGRRRYSFLSAVTGSTLVARRAGT